MTSLYFMYKCAQCFSILSHVLLIVSLFFLVVGVIEMKLFVVFIVQSKKFNSFFFFFLKFDLFVIWYFGMKYLTTLEYLVIQQCEKFNLTDYQII